MTVCKPYQMVPPASPVGIFSLANSSLCAPHTGFLNHSTVGSVQAMGWGGGWGAPVLCLLGCLPHLWSLPPRGQEQCPTPWSSQSKISPGISKCTPGGGEAKSPLVENRCPNSVVSLPAGSHITHLCVTLHTNTGPCTQHTRTFMQ